MSASPGLKAVLVLVALVAGIAVAVALVQVVRRPRARLGWLAVAAGSLLLPLATLPVINEVTAASGRFRVICGKPAMVFENPAFSSGAAPLDDGRVSPVAACRDGFAGRWRLTALVGGAGALLVSAGVVSLARGGGPRGAPRPGDPVVTGPVVSI